MGEKTQVGIIVTQLCTRPGAPWGARCNSQALGPRASPLVMMYRHCSLNCPPSPTDSRHSCDGTGAGPPGQRPGPGPGVDAPSMFAEGVDSKLVISRFPPAASPKWHLIRANLSPGQFPGLCRKRTHIKHQKTKKTKTKIQTQTRQQQQQTRRGLVKA